MTGTDWGAVHRYYEHVRQDVEEWTRKGIIIDRKCPQCGDDGDPEQTGTTFEIAILSLRCKKYKNGCRIREYSAIMKPWSQLEKTPIGVFNH